MRLYLQWIIHTDKDLFQTNIINNNISAISLPEATLERKKIPGETYSRSPYI